jgi:hypothetical protein
MAEIELGRWNHITANILIGRLQSEGIAAFPLPQSSGYDSGEWIGILIDDSDLQKAREIVLATDTKRP